MKGFCLCLSLVLASQGCFSMSLNIVYACVTPCFPQFLLKCSGSENSGTHFLVLRLTLCWWMYHLSPVVEMAFTDEFLAAFEQIAPVDGMDVDAEWLLRPAMRGGCQWSIPLL